MTRFVLILTFVVLFAVSVIGQPKPVPTGIANSNAINSTPAYAEVVLRRVELQSELESLLIEFTDDYPKVKDLRLELEILKAEADRLLAVKPSDSAKLTLALGKLVIGKVSHAAALKRLQLNYQDNHPNVKKEKRQVEIFEAAIKEILD